MNRDYVCSITPVEFEKYCKEILLAYAEEEKLPDFQITHDKRIHTYDGKYQIDLYAIFTALGANFKVICECKQYKYRVNREKVVILADKIKSIGAHKGILLTTSDYQQGAVQYAKEHGIALIRITDRGPEYICHSMGDVTFNEDDPFLYAERELPPYRAINCTAEMEESAIIYPTKATIKRIYAEMNQLIQEQYGLLFGMSENEKEKDTNE